MQESMGVRAKLREVDADHAPATHLPLAAAAASDEPQSLTSNHRRSGLSA